MSDSPAELPVVYLSFAPEDEAAATALEGRISRGGRWQVWLGPTGDSLRGESPETLARRSIRNCDAMIVLVSRASVVPGQVDLDIDAAFAERKPFLPIVLEPGLLHGELAKRWSYYLQGVQAVNGKDLRRLEPKVVQWLATQHPVEPVRISETAPFREDPRPVVFLSHSSQDLDTVRQLKEALESSGRCLVWLSEDSVLPGKHYATAIVRAIQVCDAVAVLLTPSALKSVHVSTEVGLGKGEGKPILPATLDAALQRANSLPGQWPYFLQGSSVVRGRDVASLAEGLLSQWLGNEASSSSAIVQEGSAIGQEGSAIVPGEASSGSAIVQASSAIVVPDAPTYPLAHDPDGRSWTVRENLADIVERELLGPAKGETEVVTDPPDGIYLVGRIAPVRLTDGDAQPAGAEEAPPDDLALAEGRGLPATGPDVNEVEVEEDTVEDRPQQRGLMVPASMGLRFQLPLDRPEVTVTASWGVYEPFDSGKTTKGGRQITHYQRSQVTLPVVLRIADLTPGDTASYPLLSDVALKVDRYDDSESDQRLIEIALCNDRVTPRRIPVNAWLFQTRLEVTAGGDAVFLPVTDVLTDARWEPDDERRRLNLQYRDRLEFGIGRTCSADWQAESGARRASAVRTTWLPVAETPQTMAEEIAEALLDMTKLAVAGPAEIEAGLRPIVAGYTAWLDAQEAAAASLPDHLADEAADAVHEARQVRDQLVEGLEFLVGSERARRCFAFMNRVMADQRIQTQVAELRAQQPRLGRTAARDQVLAKGPVAHSWRTFQLAFILMQLPGLTEPDRSRRSGDVGDSRVELLFFPTGGGKTEAYLGLAAYTFAIRRLQGVLDTADGVLEGGSGVAVLMRYTLRLLTAQQFQRATALVCAAELARRDDPGSWGAEPFRIGLWVGTDVSPKRYDEAKEQLQRVNEGRGHRLTVLQVQRCPWCGTRIGAANVKPVEVERRIHVYCGDEFGECPFAEGGSAGEGLPILTVDEEIYRLAPTFVIATVDKFARLARQGEAASLFGYVRKRCDRHGYVHEDYPHCTIQDGGKHPAKNGVPAAPVRLVARLRPPDLIIQDELHLITGALGTTVGLFELALDLMCSWTTRAGRPVKPLVVASTATARNAPQQVRSLYGRGVSIFPPRVLDAADTFFAREVPIDETTPGRRYLGVSPTGVRLSAAEIRIAEVVLSAGQLLLDRSGVAADPYLTLVGYFNATRELAGMTRYLSDDVQTALSRGLPWTDLPRRPGTAMGSLNVSELTSRVASAAITSTLDAMAVGFDPRYDSTDGRRQLAEQRKAGQPVESRERAPFDVVLATSMLQVGVDVSRLGLMLVVGQPKNTAEYIQASSRVGRDPARPGLVLTLGNWARPRDLAHFEQFRHSHETFYAQVEPLSVTPFSVTSIERGLDGVLVSVARVLQAHRADGGSAEKKAGRVVAEQDLLEKFIDALVERALRASDEDSAKLTRGRLENRLGQWQKRRAWLAQQHLDLAYERVWDGSKFGALMVGAEDAAGQALAGDAAPFSVPNSMREVQPEVNLLVTPTKEKLFAAPPPGAPAWQFPSPEEADA